MTAPADLGYHPLASDGDHDLWVMPIIDFSLGIFCNTHGEVWRFSWAQNFAGQGMDDVYRTCVAAIEGGAEPNEVEPWAAGKLPK